MSEQMISPETQNPEAITVEVQPVHIPEEHREDIGPMDDNVAESWRYNPQVINDYYRGRPLDVVGRLIEIALPVLSFVIGIWWDKLRGKSPKNEIRRAVQLPKLPIVLSRKN